VHAALAEQHLDIRFVRLRVQVVNQEDGQIDFFAYYHGRNLGVSAERAGMHPRDLGVNTLVSEGFFH
jgi:hypothetical protein